MARKASGFMARPPLPRIAGDSDGKGLVAPEPAQCVSAIVVGSADEGDLAVAIGVGPFGGRWEVQGRFVRGLHFDHVAAAARGVIEDVLVALDDVQIVMGNRLHIKAPTGVLARTEGVIDHVADGGNAEGAHLVDGFGAHPKQLVGPEDVGFFGLRDSEQIAVKAVDGRSGGEAVRDLVDDWICGQVVEKVEWNDLVPKTLERPKSIQR